MDLVTSDFVKTFAQFVVVAQEAKPEIEKKLSVLGKEWNDLAAKRDAMFAFEDKDPISQTLSVIMKEYKSLKATHLGYTEKLDPEAFTLRNSEGLPIFMILDIDDRDRVFGIKVTYQHRVSFMPSHLPKMVQAKMQDVVELLYKKTKAWRAPLEVTLHAELSGHMPDDVRTEVRRAKDAKNTNGLRLFDNIFVIAEAPKWEFNKMPLVKTDPLVVGWNDYCQEFFLITTYNPTDLEAYLKEQYAHTFG